MPFEQQLLLGVVIPAVVASLVMAVGVWRLWAWGGVLGVAIGYLAGQLFVRGIPRRPPVEAVDWLPPLVLLAMQWACLEASSPMSRVGRRLVEVAVLAATVLLLSAPMIGNVWTRVEAVAWLAGLVVGIGAIGSVVDASAERDSGPIVPFVLGLLTAALAVVQVLSSSILLARLSGAAAITIAPLAFVAWRWPRKGLVRAALPVILVLFYGTLLVGFFYSEISRGSALVLALSPLATAFSLVGKRRWVGMVLAVVVAVSCVGAAVGIAVATATPEPAAVEY
jgi:hypothetical protein